MQYFGQKLILVKNIYSYFTTTIWSSTNIWNYLCSFLKQAVPKLCSPYAAIGQGSRSVKKKRQELNFSLQLPSTHNYFCHFLKRGCTNPWMPLRRDCPKLCSLIAIFPITIQSINNANLLLHILLPLNMTTQHFVQPSLFQAYWIFNLLVLISFGLFTSK